MYTLYSIGHSTRTFAEFLHLLQESGITHLVDIRTVPKSRRVPWFNYDVLANSLAENNIGYSHIPQLGGLRRPRKDSINMAWRNTSFRGYADYMQTGEFEQGLGLLNELLQNKCVAIMCAEAVPWRCHRSLVADAELIRGIEVKHIISASSIKTHKLTSFAVVDPTKEFNIIYPISSEATKTNG